MLLKGVILAGGTGTRLHPLTKVTNKHLLPVGPYPMIFWPIMKLKEAGINDILLITHEAYLSSFQTLLQDGKEFDINLQYAIQPTASGISHALQFAQEFTADDKFLLLLGDNIFEDNLRPFIKEFQQQKEGARVLLKKVADPERFGVAQLDEERKKIIGIIEKPKEYVSPYAVTGIYMYGPEVFSLLKEVSPSARGEMEITDVNNLYIQKSTLQYNILSGWWIDAGTHEALFQANQVVYEQLQKTGREGK